MSHEFVISVPGSSFYSYTIIQSTANMTDWQEEFDLGWPWPPMPPVWPQRAVPLRQVQRGLRRVGCRLSAISQSKSELWACGSSKVLMLLVSSGNVVYIYITHAHIYLYMYVRSAMFWMFLVHQLHIVVKGISVVRCKFQALHWTSSMVFRTL